MLQRNIIYLLKYIFFWLLIFNLSRLIFILFYMPEFVVAGFDTILLFKNGLALDLSMASYFTLAQVLLLLINTWSEKFHALKVDRILVFVLSLCYFALCAAELNLYAEWGSKLDYRGLAHLANPMEVINISSTKQTLLFVVFTIVPLYIFNKMYGWFFALTVPERDLKFLQKLKISLLTLLISVPLLVLTLRGGLQQIPINQSSCYFSKHNIVNITAVNSLWNLMSSIETNSTHHLENAYLSMDKAEADSITTVLNRSTHDKSELFVHSTRPNIVFIILESWSGDLIKSCGGDSLITPHFAELEKDGYLFNRVYASGIRSDQGMACIFSGYPSQPTTSVINEPSKYKKLPFLTKSLAEQGYSTSFLYGGELAFGNIKSYIVYNRFDRIKEMADFSGIPTGKLGIHDEFMFAEHLNEVKQLKQPFFSALFTVSTHSPYDIPRNVQKINYGGEMNDYLNSAVYADSCLGAYFVDAKKQEWYKNTLFVLVADHGHRTHLSKENYTPDFHKVPLLFLGGALKEEFRGKQNSTIASQTDIAATVLSQLGLNYESFNWSKNLMDKNDREFSFYSYNDGMGWVSPEGYYVYDFIVKKEIMSDLPDSLKAGNYKEGNAYIQALIDDYLSK